MSDHDVTPNHGAKGGPYPGLDAWQEAIAGGKGVVCPGNTGPVGGATPAPASSGPEKPEPSQP